MPQMSKKELARLDKLEPNKKSKAERSSGVEEPAPRKKSKAERKAEAAPKAQPSQPSQKAKEAPKSSPKVNTLAHLRCELFSRLLSLPVERFGAKFRKLICGIMPVFPHYRSVPLSSPTMQHSDLVLALNTLALVALEECHFECTAIAVVFRYGNTPMRLHTHMNDHSPISGIITVGDYVGGALFVEEGGTALGGGGGVPAIGTNDGRQVRGSLHDVSRGVKFDSHALHGPWPWDGNHIALVYYCRAAAQEVTSEEQQHMRPMGFPIGA